MHRLLVYEVVEGRERVVEHHDVTHRHPSERKRLRNVLELAYRGRDARIEEVTPQ